jgi:WD40 repeat protein
VACQHEAGVTQLAWHPKNSWLVSAGVDRSVRAWDAKTGNLLVAWTGHRDMIMGLAISPDGTYVVSASDDNTARVWQFPNQ